MIIPVHMFAFADKGDRSVVRPVEVPDDEAEGYGVVENLLELVFKYGQNDFQPKNFPSVSVGDVAEVDGKYYMVMGMGFQEISKEEFESLKPPTSFYAMEKGIKEAAKGEST